MYRYHKHRNHAALEGHGGGPEGLDNYYYYVYYLNALRAYTATVPMTQYDVPEVSRRFRPHLPLHFAIQISEK